MVSNFDLGTPLNFPGRRDVSFLSVEFLLLQKSEAGFLFFYPQWWCWHFTHTFDADADADADAADVAVADAVVGVDTVVVADAGVLQWF